MPIELPQLNYIIFQLVSFYADTPDQIKEERVVSLAVIPTMLDYTLTSRDAIYQTQNIFTDKFPIAPVRCTLSGTTGNLPRPESLSFLDGLGRLKEMELLFRQSHSVDDKKLEANFIRQQGISLKQDENKKQKIYGLNYYDFIFHQYFRINLQSFHFYGNARQNTKLKYYDLQFVSSGEHYGLLSQDPLLLELTAVMGMISLAVAEINDFTTDLINNDYVKSFTYIYDAVSIAAELALSTKEIADQFGSSMIKTVVNSGGLTSLW